MHCPEVKSCPSCGGLFLRSGWKVRNQPEARRTSQQKGCSQPKATKRSTALVRAQSDSGLTTTDSNGQTVQLVAAVEQGQLAVKPAAPPVVLKWCSSGQQELQIVSNALNATVIALAVIAVGERLLDESTFLWWQQWDIIQPIRHVTQALWQAYDGGIESNPILAKVCLSACLSPSDHPAKRHVCCAQQIICLPPSPSLFSPTSMGPPDGCGTYKHVWSSRVGAK